MTAAFDAEHARAFLTGIYSGRAGFLQVCRPRPDGGGMLSECFTADDSGITAAVVHAQLLDRSRPAAIYFRATTMTAPPTGWKRGGAELTAATPMLWADVDHGTEGHKGANLPPDREAAELVIAESGMPAPTILVHSGGGLYPLWRLDRTVDPADAAVLSERVQALMLVASQRHGWDYGTGVSDLARVLRLPGSVNRKTANERPCRVLGGTGVPIDPSTVPAAPAPAETATSPAAAPRMLPAARPLDPNRAAGPLDALAEHTTWADILSPAGWTHIATEPDGAERWLRPGGASSEYSARAFAHNLVVHSDNAGLPSGPRQRNTKGRVFAHLHHSGDVSAAARDLVLAAHGTGGSPAARALPAAVLGAAKTAHIAHDADMWGQLGATLPLAVGNPHPPLSVAHSAHQPPAPSTTDRAQLSLVATPPPPTGLARFLLPAEVWSFSPQLHHIYRAAMARLVCPDALLHAILAILASHLHHGSRVETGKGPSVLSYYLAVVGASGAGKSEALKVARDLLASWTGARLFLTGTDSYIDAPLGSGEGLIEAFMGEVYVDKLEAGQPVISPLTGQAVQVKLRSQVRHNALFHTDEGRQVLAIDARKGATVLAVLCEMWSGSVAGQTNAEQARTRKLDAGTYVVGMLLGFQTATIDALFADEAGGAPQRFAFAPAEYAPFGDDLDGEHLVEWPGELQLHVPAGPVSVALAPEQQQAVRRSIRMKAAGISPDGPLDGHRTLLHCRIAALLALLHGAQQVTDQMWTLAETLTVRSSAMRDELAALGARKIAEQQQAKQDATVQATVRAQREVSTSERITRAAAQIARAVERAGGTLTRGKALHGIRSDLRDVRDAALDQAARTGLVVVSPDGKTIALAEGGEA